MMPQGKVQASPTARHSTVRPQYLLLLTRVQNV
jgi:hypothetical protein